MRTVTVAVIVVAPLLVVLYDVLVLFLSGPQDTITWVTREWHARSAWPEAIYVLGAVVLWLHLFRRFL